jgi:hypothetical protein
MDQNDLVRYQLCIRAMFASFSSECTEATMQGYWLGLSDMSIEQVEIAVAKSIRKCKFVPKPVELRELAGLHQDDDDLAIAAWGDVLKAVRLGPYKHVDFEDKLCNAVIRNLGGWITFLERFRDAESEKWTRYDFVKCYKAFSRSGVSGDLIAPLAGLNQFEVANGELCAPVPKKIPCDPNRAESPKLLVENMFAVPKIERQMTEQP